MKKLKGTAYIELIDEKTGEVENVKEDNMLTNALNHMFNEGMFNHCAYYNSSSTSSYNSKHYLWDPDFFFPLIQNTIGGILLFSDNIPEDPEQIYAPADAHCIGYASIDGYNKTNTFRGSFNPAESGYLENGYRFVWNFTTSQANGEIKCLGLTTPFGGKYGYGMSLDTTARETVQTTCNSHVDKTAADSRWLRIGPFFAPGTVYRSGGSTDSRYGSNKDILWKSYFTDNTFETLQISKYNASNNELTLIGKRPNSNSLLKKFSISTPFWANNLINIYCHDNGSLSSSERSDIYNYSGSYIQFIYDFDDSSNQEGYLYLLSLHKANHDSNRGKLIYLMKINLDDGTIVFEKTISLSNFTPPYTDSHSSNYPIRYGCVRNNSLYLTQSHRTINGISGDGYTILKINLDTEEQTKIELPKYKNNSWNFSSELYNHALFKIKGRIISPLGYILDSNDNILYYPVISSEDSSSNTSIYSFGNYNTQTGYPLTNMFTYSYIGGSTSSSDQYTNCGVSFYTPCLFTINNLTTPITKTQDKAMKITYILREEE